ncbi:MAG: DUF1150 family protein [Azospirillum sp.]|nr:DUF1150 family protein [Azospirillum sp.]
MNTSQTHRAQLSTKDFAAFGVDLVAYIKPVTVKGATSYAIHAADGTPLTILHERDAAYATVRQHEMEPVSVH